jgi:hypothetical protein
MESLDVPAIAKCIHHRATGFLLPLQPQPAHIKGDECVQQPDLLVATLSGTVKHTTLRQEQNHSPEFVIILIVIILRAK